MTNITDLKMRHHLKGLYDYLKHNQDYLVNYAEWDQENKTYSSAIAINLLRFQRASG